MTTLTKSMVLQRDQQKRKTLSSVLHFMGPVLKIIIIAGACISFGAIFQGILFSMIFHNSIFSVLIQCLMPISLTCIFYLAFKKMPPVVNRENQALQREAEDFVVVEDEIFDKYKHSSYKRDDYEYYVCGKLYGEIQVTSHLYNNANKSDHIYLIREVGKDTDRFLFGEYLCKEYCLDNELRKTMIPYKQELGEKEYQSHLTNRAAQGTRVTCRKCGYKFIYKQQFSVCPKCNSLYALNDTDLLYCKEWR